MNIVALIPARAGSKRIPGKNTKLLGGKPLIQWTIEAAKASGVFGDIVVCSDEPVEWEAALDSCISWQRRNRVSDIQPDIEWVREALAYWPCEAFAILRPTSPFRTADTIRRAFAQFKQTPCSSLRAVEPVKQHPGKMWQVRGDRMSPVIGKVWPAAEGEAAFVTHTPFHSQPTQSLPTVYVQNSSLEIAWTWCVTIFDSISGPKVAPFLTDGWEGFTIDYPDDWDRAERHVADLQAAAPAQ